MTFEFFASHYNYYIVVILMMLGLYAVFSSGNMVKRLVGLGVFQASVFLFYITIGKVAGGQPPILPETHHGENGHYQEQVDQYGDATDDEGEPAASDRIPAQSGETPDVVIRPQGVDERSDVTLEASGDGGAHADQGDHGQTQGDDDGHGDGEDHDEAIYSNPLPHVLILTAIVVGVATLSVGLALVVRVREAYGSIEEEDLNLADHEDDVREAAA